MSKKVVIKKETQKMPREGLLTSLFKAGNFWLLRKKAREYLAQHDSGQESEMAKRMLMVTSPDAVALLSGVFCFIVSMTVLFLAAYKG